MENEIWKNVKNYEGYYMISNFGRVKSLKRQIEASNRIINIKERILKQTPISSGYLSVKMGTKQEFKTQLIHQLVAIHFLNHKANGYNLVVNHKDHNKHNNHFSNLEILDNRINAGSPKRKLTSKYLGVHFRKDNKKWRSRIKINGQTINIGQFDTELEAHNAYKNKLKELKNEYN